MMDCDTTGIEPDLALIKYKKLVGGGMIKIVNNTVPTALFKLGYNHDQADAIVSYIDATGTIEGAPHVKDDHLAVFDCSFKPSKGTRSIAYMGHLRMMAAAQPFISGAISKTVNLPNNASVEDIMETYLQAWKLGIKAVAVYRDGCKQSQPLSAAGSKTANSTKDDARIAAAPQVEEADLNSPPRSVRHKLQEERASITHKFKVGDHEGYITVGLYPNGEPGELFVKMAKEGSTVSGLMDSFALAVSLALQHGVPLKVFCEKFAHTRFEPSGWSGNPDIGYAKSIMDYIFRWLQMRFLTGQQQIAVREFQTPDIRRRTSARRHRGSQRRTGSIRAEVRGPRSKVRQHPRRRRPLEHRRPGRRPQLQLLRQHHDQKRQLLPLRELREYERVQLDLA